MGFYCISWLNDIIIAAEAQSTATAPAASFREGGDFYTVEEMAKFQPKQRKVTSHHFFCHESTQNKMLWSDCAYRGLLLDAKKKFSTSGKSRHWSQLVIIHKSNKRCEVFLSLDICYSVQCVWSTFSPFSCFIGAGIDKVGSWPTVWT